MDYRTAFGGGITVVGKRPAYYSLQQVNSHLDGYTSITRVPGSEDLRLYKVEKPGGSFFIAWYGYQDLYLPEDSMPRKSYRIDVGAGTVVVEEMKVSTPVVSDSVATEDGMLEIELTPEPVYIFAE
jgi:hypothetical protein